MDSRQPARKSAPVLDSGVWGTTQVLTPTVQEHRNVLQWSTEILRVDYFCCFAYLLDCNINLLWI